MADAQRGVFRSAVPVAEIPESVDAEPDPEAVALLHDDCSRQVTLMENLPAAQREIIVLRVAMGMSTEETRFRLVQDHHSDVDGGADDESDRSGDTACGWGGTANPGNGNPGNNGNSGNAGNADGSAQDSSGVDPGATPAGAQSSSLTTTAAAVRAAAG